MQQMWLIGCSDVHFSVRSQNCVWALFGSERSVPLSEKTHLEWFSACALTGVSWTQCDWWTCCWCCCSRVAKRCPSLGCQGWRVASRACDAWTAPGSGRTGSSSTVSAARTRTRSLMRWILAVRVAKTPCNLVYMFDPWLYFLPQCSCDLSRVHSPPVFISGFEVNFMDDVGQTLLNWASAFGTQEMVLETLLSVFPFAC